MTESEYLISMAVSQYNTQYNFSLNTVEFDVRSLDTRVNFDRSYEIYDIGSDNLLRLHIHLIFDNADALGPYSVETDETFRVGALGDEVFVATGKIDSYYRDNSIYKFLPIIPNETNLPIILQENGLGIESEDGQFILLETTP